MGVKRRNRILRILSLIVCVLLLGPFLAALSTDYWTDRPGYHAGLWRHCFPDFGYCDTHYSYGGSLLATTVLMCVAGASILTTVVWHVLLIVGGECPNRATADIARQTPKGIIGMNIATAIFCVGAAATYGVWVWDDGGDISYYGWSYWLAPAVAAGFLLNTIAVILIKSDNKVTDDSSPPAGIENEMVDQTDRNEDVESLP